MRPTLLTQLDPAAMKLYGAVLALCVTRPLGPAPDPARTPGQEGRGAAAEGPADAFTCGHGGGLCLAESRGAQVFRRVDVMEA